MMLRRMARTAANNACTVPGDREEVIVTDEPDPAMDVLVARSTFVGPHLGWFDGSLVVTVTTDRSAMPEPSLPELEAERDLLYARLARRAISAAGR